MSITGKTGSEEVLEVPNLMENEEVEAKQEIYQMVRWIIPGNVSNIAEDRWCLSDVNLQINQRLMEGYELFDTHYLGKDLNAYGMFYVLVRWV